MKFKKFIVKEYVEKTPFGKFTIGDVELLCDVNNPVSASDFNQDEDDFFISSESGQKVTIECLKKILSLRDYDLDSEKLVYLLSCMGISPTDLSKMIEVNKSTVARWVSGESAISEEKSKSIFGLIAREAIKPGAARLNSQRVKSKLKNLKDNPRHIAEYFVRFFEDQEDRITHLKLQKLMYYSFVTALEYKFKLFEEDIYAWDHGPVVSDIYGVFASNGKFPISRNDFMGELSLSQEAITIANEVIEKYGKYSAWKLRDMTHDEEPWIIHYEKGSNNKIELASMLECFAA